MKTWFADRSCIQSGFHSDMKGDRNNTMAAVADSHRKMETSSGLSMILAGCLIESTDCVYAIDSLAVEAYFRKIDSKTFLNENDDLDGVDRLETPADQDRVMVRQVARIPVCR